MNKVGRNVKCPCGSGKKYKHCCADKPRKSEPQRGSGTVTMPAMLPGTRFNFVLCHKWKDPNDPRNHASPAGSPGSYRVVVTLGRSGGTLAGDLQAQGAGDSFIQAPQVGNGANPELPCVGLEYGIGDEVIHFDVYPNTEGRLARVVAASLKANTFTDAEVKVLRAVHGLLSQLAVKFAVPLHVAKVEIVELATGNQRLALVTPYNDARVASEFYISPSTDFKFYASLYREALNSNTPVYQFLCFYKIIEGLRTRRNRIASERKCRGADAQRFVEVVPLEPIKRKSWLTDLFNIKSDRNLSITSGVSRPIPL